MTSDRLASRSQALGTEVVFAKKPPSPKPLGRKLPPSPFDPLKSERGTEEVAGLGVFVELELMADTEELDAARASILSLAETLGLKGSERRSYLELLKG